MDPGEVGVAAGPDGILGGAGPRASPLAGIPREQGIQHGYSVDHFPDRREPERIEGVESAVVAEVQVQLHAARVRSTPGIGQPAPDVALADWPRLVSSRTRKLSGATQARSRGEGWSRGEDRVQAAIPTAPRTAMRIPTASLSFHRDSEVLVAAAGATWCWKES